MQTNHSCHALVSQFPIQKVDLRYCFAKGEQMKENHSLSLENREDTLASLPVI